MSHNELEKMFIRWAGVAMVALAVVSATWVFADELAALHSRTLADKTRTGGQTTVYVTNKHAFGRSAANMPLARQRDFSFGNRLFNTNWVTAPASVQSLDGLGPLFNRASCSGCHTRDGRGRPPMSPDEAMVSMLVRLSMLDDAGQAVPHPMYGSQLNDRAIVGVPAEGRASLRWEPVAGKFDDGQPYELHRTVISFVDMGYGAMDEDVMFSPRVAPQVFGLGLLEAIPDAAILAKVDADDADGDGISGRANYVLDEARGEIALGRFGWKSNQPTLRQQITGAFLGDIGITTSMFPRENVVAAQTAANESAHGGEPELSNEFLDKIEFYMRMLAPPAARGLEKPVVQRGEAMFFAANCHTCHTPEFQTGHHPEKELAYQTIRPFTDLLLHDMGEGLADHRPDGLADGREWRTPPLWGLGLVPVVNRHSFYLHDGRARNLEEAVLWHGGEGQASADAYRAMSKADREALIAFLKAI